MPADRASRSRCRPCTPTRRPTTRCCRAPTRTRTPTDPGAASGQPGRAPDHPDRHQHGCRQHRSGRVLQLRPVGADPGHSQGHPRPDRHVDHGRRPEPGREHQDVWWLRVRRISDGNWSARSQARPLLVGEVTLSCDPNSSSGNSAPWTSLGRERPQRPRAQHPDGIRPGTTLKKWTTTPIPGQNACNSHPNGVISTDRLGKENTNCLQSVTGLKGPGLRRVPQEPQRQAAGRHLGHLSVPGTPRPRSLQRELRHPQLLPEEQHAQAQRRGEGPWHRPCSRRTSGSRPAS